jgi:hypothetical protein
MARVTITIPDETYEALAAFACSLGIPTEEVVSDWALRSHAQSVEPVATSLEEFFLQLEDAV